MLLAIGGGIAAYCYFALGRRPAQYQGWVEADFIFVSPDEIGRIETLAVREGSTVEVGSPLFTLDDDLQRAAVADNEAAVTNAKQSQQPRGSALEARRRHAEGLRRCRSRAALGRGEAELGTHAAGAQAAGEPGGRHDPGSLLPRRRNGGRRSSDRFDSAAEEHQDPLLRAAGELAAIQIGDRVQVSCDGCRNDLYARVSFISAQAEFSPPVIYSLEERARLVFRIEALPERPEDVRIGQPASVALLNAPPRGDGPCREVRTSPLTRATAATRGQRQTSPSMSKGCRSRSTARQVVRNLSLQVRRGQIYGFLGPNGSGKTTTLRMICGLLTPDGGRGTCLGYDILTEREKIKRLVGYMTQRFSLYQDLSIKENLEFVARVYGLPDPGARREAGHRAAGAAGARAAARRHAVRRLEATPRARRLHSA